MRNEYGVPGIRQEMKWQASDLIIAAIIFLVTGVPLFGALKRLSFIHVDIAESISYLIATFAVIYFLNRAYPIRLLSKFNIRDAFCYSMGSLAVCFLIYAPAYYDLWSGGVENLPKQFRILNEVSLMERSFFLVDLCLLGPMTEELLFRGFIYRILRNRYTILWGTIISTIAFYLFHGGESNVRIILVSLVFTYAYEKSGTIWSSIIVHSLNNALWVILLYLGVKYNS